MNDQRLGGIALIAGALAGIVALAFHPTGDDFLGTAEHFRAVALQGSIVHTLALAAVPLSFLGALALTARLNGGADRIALGGLVVFAVGQFAIAIAAVASGYMAPGLIRKALEVGTDQSVWRIVVAYNGLLNQAFAKLDVLATGAALALWSVAMLRARRFPPALAVYGLVVGAVLLAGGVANMLPLNVHGFGGITLAVGLWMIATGLIMMKPPDAAGALR